MFGSESFGLRSRCVFATLGEVQRVSISRALWRSEADVRAALHELALAKVLILAPNDGNIWAANPFCAVPSGFRVAAAGKHYWGICIWDALGIAAASTRTSSRRRNWSPSGASPRVSPTR